LIAFLHVNIVTTTDDLLEHVSTCIGHHVLIICNGDFVCLLYFSDNCSWCGVCTGMCSL